MKDNKLQQEWKQRLAECKTSGKTISAWCQEQSITENQYFYWRKKLEAQPAKQEQPVKWLPLAIDKIAKPNPGAITVHIGEAAIEIKPGFDQGLLREIIQVLKTPC